MLERSVSTFAMQDFDWRTAKNIRFIACVFDVPSHKPVAYKIRLHARILDANVQKPRLMKQVLLFQFKIVFPYFKSKTVTYV